MEETLLRLERAFEESLAAFLASEGTEYEADAYRRFLETFETLKGFEMTSAHKTETVTM